MIIKLFWNMIISAGYEALTKKYIKQKVQLNKED